MCMCVYVHTHRSHTQELTFCSLTTNTPLLVLFLAVQEDQDQPFLSLSPLLTLPSWLTAHGSDSGSVSLIDLLFSG